MKNYCHLEEGVEVVPNAWSSELSEDLIGLIAEKIRSSLSLSEFIRFGCVCLGWRCFSIRNYQHIKLRNKQLPVLLIPLSSPLHHHQKKISSSPSSSSLCDDEEEEGEEEHTAAAEGEKEPEEEPEELCDDDDDDDDEEEEHKAADEDAVKDANKVVEAAMAIPGHYYNPKDIWQGQDAKQRHRSVRNFYSLSEKTVYHDFPLPVPYYKNILGTSHGWLVTVEECYADDGQLYLSVSLLNPFRPADNNEIQLPPLTQGNPGNLARGERICHSYYLVKAFLSANPSSLSDPTTQLVVFGVYGSCRLAFCRPCDKSWTPLVEFEDYRPIEDIICYNDQFYAILQNGYVFAFVFKDASQQRFSTPPIITITEAFSSPKEYGYRPTGMIFRYLVESGGDLLQVRRMIVEISLQESLEQVGLPTPTESDGYITRQFLVFKLDPTTGEWVEIKTLNDHMIFIGNSGSISIPASDLPEGWCIPNSIYYTDVNHEHFNCEPQTGPHDIGVFNLEDGIFKRHYEAESKTIMPPPVWIQPML